MKSVHPNLWVGDQRDEEELRGHPAWYFVHACKEPYHRELLGYRTTGAPKHHPWYLYAPRPGRIALNLVDVDDVAMIRREVIDAAVSAIADAIDAGLNVLVHCNQGRSRSPTIAMLYLARHTDTFDGLDFAEAVDRFQELYPQWAPAMGIGEYAWRNWSDYAGRPSNEQE